MSKERNIAISVNPTFTLFDIVSEDVIEEYDNGAFRHVTIPNVDCLCKEIKQVFAPNFSLDSSSDAYLYKDKTGGQTIVYTTNCREFKQITETGEQCMGGRCLYCNYKFTHQSIGIPLRADAEYDDRGHLHHTFYTEGVFHDFRCALAHLELMSYRYRVLHPDARMYLLLMYSLMHPHGSALKPANDFLLLEKNGGSMDFDTWSKDRYIYVETPNVIIGKAKMTFERRVAQD